MADPSCAELLIQILEARSHGDEDEVARLQAIFTANGCDSMQSGDPDEPAEPDTGDDGTN